MWRKSGSAALLYPKRHIIQADCTLKAGAADGARRAFHLYRRVQDFEDPPRAYERLLHGVDDRGNIVDLAGELIQQAGEDDQARPRGSWLCATSQPRNPGAPSYSPVSGTRPRAKKD